MPTAASGAVLANSNGKRPHGTIDDSTSSLASTNGGGNTAGGVNGGRRGEFTPKTHEASGYTWDRAEDEPGWAWLNKRAHDEFGRAAEGLVHVGGMIRGKLIQRPLGIWC